MLNSGNKDNIVEDINSYGMVTKKAIEVFMCSIKQISVNCDVYYFVCLCVHTQESVCVCMRDAHVSMCAVAITHSFTTKLFIIIHARN